MIHVYGIPNCGSVKKALDLLNKERTTFTFHDFKKEGVTTSQLKKWAKSIGWEPLLNKKGTTWRGLPEGLKVSAVTQSAAIAIMQENTSVIKRPLIEWGDGTVTVGLDEIIFLKKIHQ